MSWFALNDSVAIPTLTSPEVWACGLVGDYACALTDPDVLPTSDNVLVRPISLCSLLIKVVATFLSHRATVS